MYSECRHIMPSGSKCHSPALRGEPYCYYHVKLHRFSDSPSPSAMTVFSIEDTRGIQLALTQVLTALNSPYMDTRRAGLMLYGLQIAAQLVRRTPGDKPEETVRVCEETNGVSLAPPKEICEPATDCAPCPRRHSCPNYKSPKGQEEEEEEQHRLEEERVEADREEEEQEREERDPRDREEREGREPGNREEEKEPEENESAGGEQAASEQRDRKREPAAPYPEEMSETTNAWGAPGPLSGTRDKSLTHKQEVWETTTGKDSEASPSPWSLVPVS